MTTAIATIDHSNAALVDTALERLTHLLRSQGDVPKQTLEVAIASLSTPARPEWVMARTASLLSPYYEKDVPQGVRVMEAEDWADALAEFPQWAIQKAAQWWKSADNPDRRKRPLEGDIAARARFEMQAVRAAQIKLRSNGTFSLVQTKEQTEGPPKYRVSRERASEILAEAGYRPKRMEPVDETV